MLRMITSLLSGLTHRQRKQSEPTKTGGLPPCQCVPLDSSTPKEDGENRKSINMQVYITESIHKGYYKFEERYTEAQNHLI